ncbi:MAG TPA: DNA cytosine methyltransferase [Anaerolineae bacterium]
MLVLSLFPGIGLLDMAFEDQGFCVVRGPDLLWGGDIKQFHPPAGKFDGVIGGPPCQLFSKLRYLNPHAGKKHGNMIPEFERCIVESQPRWFLMENVPEAPIPCVSNYGVSSFVLNNRWLGATQNRKRRFSFGVSGVGVVNLLSFIEVALFESSIYETIVTSKSSKVPVAINGSGQITMRLRRLPTITGARGSNAPFNRGKKYGISEICELQGLSSTFLSDAPFTDTGKRQVIGNGVPLPMGRAIAKAVKAALESEAL